MSEDCCHSAVRLAVRDAPAAQRHVPEHAQEGAYQCQLSCIGSPVGRHGLPVSLGNAPERQRQQPAPPADRAHPDLFPLAPTQKLLNNSSQSNRWAPITQHKSANAHVSLHLLSSIGTYWHHEV